MLHAEFRICFDATSVRFELLLHVFYLINVSIVLNLESIVRDV